MSSTPAGAVLLARHGETEDNRRARFQGQLDTPLSGAGREQANALAESLEDAEIAALYSSALSRAVETAATVGERLGLEVVVDPRLNESGMGLWQGRRKTDIEREEPERWTAWRRGGASFRFPAGESLGEVQARVMAALEDVRRGSLPALVVCHGGCIRSAVAAASPRGLLAYHDIEPGNASVVALPEEATVAAIR